MPNNLGRDEVWSIKGTVLSSFSGTGIGGLRVEAWDKDLLIDDLIGAAMTDNEGQFEIEFDSTFRVMRTKGLSNHD